MEELRKLLGRADDPDNPFGYQSSIKLDESAEPLCNRASLLVEHDIHIELVPEVVGGNFTLSDILSSLNVLDPLFERDVALGLDFALPRLESALTLLLNDRQIELDLIGEYLLNGERIGVSFSGPSPALGIEYNRVSCNLSGTLELVNDWEMAKAFMLPVRRQDGLPHLVLWTSPNTLKRLEAKVSDRRPLVGARILHLYQLYFTQKGSVHRLATDDFCFVQQTTRTPHFLCLAILATSSATALETALKTTLLFAHSRVLYGKRVTDLLHARELLLDAWLDLLAIRSLGYLTMQGWHSPFWDTYIAPWQLLELAKLLSRTLHNLSIVLGARHYIREGEHAIFQKIHRDLQYIIMLCRTASAEFIDFQKNCVANFDNSALVLDSIDYAFPANQGSWHTVICERLNTIPGFAPRRTRNLTDSLFELMMERFLEGSRLLVNLP